MHDTAYESGRLFLETYCNSDHMIVEIGSQNVNGSLRDFCPKGAIYLGIDVNHGPGVDLCVVPGKELPLRAEFADAVISSSVFEHDSCFWETFVELVRILKPGGFLYVNAPSNGAYHRYPRDCWRFYPDCGEAFVALARARNYPLTLVESFIAERHDDHWNDLVAIFIKSDDVNCRPLRFLSDLVPCKNITRVGADSPLELSDRTEDMRIIDGLANEIAELKATLLELKAREETLRAEFKVTDASLVECVDHLAPEQRRGSREVEV